MYKARYYKTDGKKGQARKLPASLFDGVVNEGVLHQVVKAYQANARAGTGSAKNRSAVRGGGRKPWRQKGTGRARAGTIRSPLWAGGGQAFPPIPHSWRQRIPKKLKGLARRSALNSRAEDDRVVLVDALEFDEPKTRRLVDYLEGIEVEGRVLLLTDGLKEIVYLSGRNVPWLEIKPFGEENALDVLMAEFLVIERDALEGIPVEAEVEEEEVEAGEPAAEAEPEEAPAEVEPAEAAEEVEEEEQEEEPAAEEEWPKKGGGGWWTLSNGDKVQGEAKAREAQAALDAESDDDSEEEEKG